MLDPIAVMVDRTSPGGETEAELLLVAVGDEGCTLSLDDGGTLDLDPVETARLAQALLRSVGAREAA